MYRSVSPEGSVATVWASQIYSYSVLPIRPPSGQFFRAPGRSTPGSDGGILWNGSPAAMTGGLPFRARVAPSAGGTIHGSLTSQIRVSLTMFEPALILVLLTYTQDDVEFWKEPARAQAAAAAEHVLEEIYCYCRCKENIGHRALVECFESDHGSHCDVCMNEAVIAAKMTQEGKTPKEIQQAIDAYYAG